MMPLPPARLYFLLARQAPVAVVFRRGPGNHVCLVQWNLEDDSFEVGQWLKGRVYEQRCDLSPDGRLLVYFAAQRKGKDYERHTWTAVSRPPYFTALALWWYGLSYFGGGLFASDGSLALNNHPQAPLSPSQKHGKPPFTVRDLDLPYAGDEPIERMRMLRDGWDDREGILVGRELRWQEGGSAGYRTTRTRLLVRQLGAHQLEEERPLSSEKARRIWLDGRPIVGATQADFDVDRSRVVFVREGCLWQLHLQDGSEEMIRDLNPLRFELKKAPAWAQDWK